MFARKVKNRSGSISVQLIHKDQGRYRVVRTVGTSKDPDAIERLWQQARHLAQHPEPHQGLFFDLYTPTDQAVQNVFETLANSSIRLIGPELIFGTLFDRMGFSEIPDELFRHLVIARLAYPTSKLKTTDYLYRYQGMRWSVSALYKSLDRLHRRYKQKAEEIVYRHTQKRLERILVAFYDMTTLYFEAEEEDDLRKAGLSKDGKFRHPQIMLGLLVGEGGLPLGYDLFEGNKFEGHTLLPLLQQMQKKYEFEPPVVVADAAMLSKANLDNLAAAEYSFILGGRLKNESRPLQQEILAQVRERQDQKHWEFRRKDGMRLIVTYSARRAHRDRRNREKGVARLKKRVESGSLTKDHLNQRGYNKFLALEGEMKVRVDEKKIEEDQQWDGLKGYITNTPLPAAKVTENYSHLWQIEKAFRISKTDLRIRPIHHYRRRRIEAHLCIAFVAYAIYKELERLLQTKGIEMSATRAGELTHTMYELHYILPDSQKQKTLILRMNDEQQRLYQAVHEI